MCYQVHRNCVLPRCVSCNRCTKLVWSPVDHSHGYLSALKLARSTVMVK